MAGAGGLIRDAQGRWCGGFCVNIGMCSITLAILWGLYQGLLLAWRNGIRELVEEVDSLCVTKLVSNEMVAPNASGPLLHVIKELLTRDWNVSLQHVYREANHSADFLANLALSVPVGIHVHESPPVGLNVWLQHDMYGVSYTRSILP